MNQEDEKTFVACGEGNDPRSGWITCLLPITVTTGWWWTQPQTRLRSRWLLLQKRHCGWDTLCLGFVEAAAGEPQAELGEGAVGEAQPQ